MDHFCNSVICVRKFSAIFFPIGIIQQLFAPNFTKILASTQSNGQLRILILDIQSILCSCDQAWTFYWPPTLLIHIVIEWPHMTRQSNYPYIFLPNWLIKLKKKDPKMLKLGLQNSLFYFIYFFSRWSFAIAWYVHTLSPFASFLSFLLGNGTSRASAPQHASRRREAGLRLVGCLPITRGLQGHTGCGVHCGAS